MATMCAAARPAIRRVGVRRVLVLAMLFGATGHACIASQASVAPGLIIPEDVDAPSRVAMVNDTLGLRQIQTFSMSPDRRHYAIFVQQADPVANAYHSGWFVGDVSGGALLPVGDGGDVRFNVVSTGAVPGDLLRPKVRWSADGKWIAYTLKRGDEVQLWRSRTDGALQEQVTRNASDVDDFIWAAQGERLYFTAGRPRVERQAQARQRERLGYRYDDDLMTLSDLMKPVMREVPERNLPVWAVEPGKMLERLATDTERTEYARLQANYKGADPAGLLPNTAQSVVTHANGAKAWLEPKSPGSAELTVVALRAGHPDSAPLRGEAAGASGQIGRLWWSDDGRRVLFLRRDAIARGGIGDYSLRAWTPGEGSTAELLTMSDTFLGDWEQSAVVDGQLIVSRETLSLPRHIAAIDLADRSIKMLADVNPELRNLRIGRVERLEWDLPKFDWNAPGAPLAGAFPPRGSGYVLYPPDYEPGKKYPVFIDPYAVSGFGKSAGNEHPVQAYAANGIVVLRLSYPLPDLSALGPSDKQGEIIARLYSAELGYPYMSMLMGSTLRALDEAIKRGFVDETRVGIGGVSQGTLTPLYILQKHDRITAISISASSWGLEEYYWPTRKARAGMGYDWRPSPATEAGREYWRRIDIAEHVDEIEAPILMHHALGETLVALRFMRHLADAGKPYDAYVYTNEFHVKWQPAHLQAIQQRNLDWFRFWLQDYESAEFGDSDDEAARRDQYQRWHELRRLQCNNPRSLRDYCGN